jgi:hypothetical protein
LATNKKGLFGDHCCRGASKGLPGERRSNADGAGMKKWDRRRVQPQPQFRPPKWLRQHFQEIGFAPDRKDPKDRVIAGLGALADREAEE